MKKVFTFIYVVVSILLTAKICSIFTHIGLNGWYNDFAKPMFTPANYVFPIAWSIIYVLLAASSFMVLSRADSLYKNQASHLFIAQLALQILWCFSFFAEGQLALGLVILLLLDIVVYKMIVIFLQQHKLSGLLLYPYYWWLMFATFLNAVYIAAYGVFVSF